LIVKFNYKVELTGNSDRSKMFSNSLMSVTRRRSLLYHRTYG